MRILVTGANGFIGRAFCRDALDHGHQLLALCRSAPSSQPEGCAIVRGSMSDIPWDEIAKFRPEAALHLAWIVKPGVYLQSEENHELARQAGVLFSGLAERGVSHLAGSGSCIEYAPSQRPLSEDAPTEGASSYAAAKCRASHLLRESATAAGLGWTWFRIFYCYGEGEDPARLTSSAAASLVKGLAVELKTPDSVKDFIHVADVASAMRICLEKGITGFVNVGRGEGVRILDFGRAIARAAGADASRVTCAHPPAPDPFPVTIADVTKLRSTGWRPRVSFDDGVRRLCMAARASARQLRIFVTGAGGFIGRAFCTAARKGGHEVLGLCRQAGAVLPEGCRSALGSIEGIPWAEVDSFAPDTLLHLAWCAVPGTNYFSAENASLTEQSATLFETMARHGVKHIAAAGSMVEYASSPRPLNEDTSPLSDALPYARAKQRTCENLRRLASAAGVEWTWFRLFNTYGEGEHRDRMTSSVMLRLLSGTQPPRLKSPDSIRDYTHVEDVARALLACLEHGGMGVVNIGSGTGVGILEISRMIARAAGAEPSRVRIAENPSDDLMPFAVADVRKLRATGWRPQISLEEGLRRLRASLDSQKR